MIKSDEGGSEVKAPPPLITAPLTHIKMKRTVPKYYLLLIVIALIFSCQSNEKFESSMWKSKSMVDFETSSTREDMIRDLIGSEIVLGKSKSEIIELLGNPETVDSSKFIYLVREKYGWDIDPTYIKYLEIKLDDSGKANEQNIITTQ